MDAARTNSPSAERPIVNQKNGASSQGQLKPKLELELLEPSWLMPKWLRMPSWGHVGVIWGSFEGHVSDFLVVSGIFENMCLTIVKP